MFQTVLLACLSVNMSVCYLVYDERGPYETRQQCHDRAAVMSIGVMGDGLVPRSYKCTKVQGEMTLNESNDGNKSENSKST